MLNFQISDLTIVPRSDWLDFDQLEEVEEEGENNGVAALATTDLAYYSSLKASSVDSLAFQMSFDNTNQLILPVEQIGTGTRLQGLNFN